MLCFQKLSYFQRVAQTEVPSINYLVLLKSLNQSTPVVALCSHLYVVGVRSWPPSSLSEPKSPVLTVADWPSRWWWAGGPLQFRGGWLCTWSPVARVGGACRKLAQAGRARAPMAGAGRAERQVHLRPRPTDWRGGAPGLASFCLLPR